MKALLYEEGGIFLRKLRGVAVAGISVGEFVKHLM
jgi:hypothetical protein